MSYLISLALLSGVALNALLQFGLGIRDLTLVPSRQEPGSWLRALAMFGSSLLMWCLVTWIVAPLALGFLELFFLFPAVYLVGRGIERLSGAFRLRLHPSYLGLNVIAALLALNLAVRLVDAVIVTFFFSLGHVLVTALLVRIYDRSNNEAVPAFLRGMPLLLISMGLLSLLTSQAAAILMTFAFSWF